MDNGDALNSRMKKMLIIVGIIFGIVFIYKFIISSLIKYAMTHQSEVVTVSAMKVGYAPWQPKIKASGTVRAIKGVNVTTQLAGMVQTIYFTPGAMVAAGTILVQLNADSDIALLQSLQANEELAKITYNRDLAQYKEHAVSKQTVDIDAQNLKSLSAQVRQQTDIVNKKSIQAPFSGRLGINLINLGQWINPGDKVVTLQTFDPIFVDFYVPQQFLAQIKTGQKVKVTTDAYKDIPYNGIVTTIDSAVDAISRNVLVEATVSNPQNQLNPGMYVNVDVDTGSPINYLTVPQTAISFNSYGDIVYVIKQTGKDKHNKPVLTANQVFVVTGETRGDQITVLNGIKNGDVIVTSGQLKLRNGSHVTINNSVVPSNNPNPTVTNNS